MRPDGARVVVALGGNAILRRDERGTAAEQRAAIREACDGLAALAASGNDLIVVHGNGPQVGALMLQHASAEAIVPAMPLDVLVAQTQGSLGYLIQQELGAALKRRGIASPVIAIVTEVVVDPADPAFLRRLLYQGRSFALACRPIMACAHTTTRIRICLRPSSGVSVQSVSASLEYASSTP